MNNLFEKAANGLKLIALRTLEGCDEKYINILTPGEYYYFYPNYVVDPETENITVKDYLPASFYNIGGLRVNVSAVVGKNGSGKSTLVELLLRLINNVAIKQRFPKVRFEPLENLNLALYYYADTFYKIEINGPDVLLYRYSQKGILNPKPKRNARIPEFFYSIVVNFSHYAYNNFDYDEVNWLEPLFHKNDGYQTPVVITPLRTDGNININTENQLVFARLIGNFLTPSAEGSFDFRNLSNNLRAASIKLTLKESKRSKELWKTGGTKRTDEKTFTLKDMKLGSQKEELLTKLNKIFPFKYDHIKEGDDADSIDYILYKLISICVKYPDYTNYFEKKTRRFREYDIDEFLEKLMADSSHITFKLRQMLNYLDTRDIPQMNQTLTLDELGESIKKVRRVFNKQDAEIVELLPPPIFAVDIILESKTDPSDKVLFKRLSSGEKQILYSVSSVLYHLSNLNSVIKTAKRRKYKYVNIIFEEAELYFHPEMQRSYLKYLLDAISKIKRDKIDSLNICLVTHSPFVLSDIPSGNILFLQQGGKPAKDELKFATFGANIHDILKQSFFLDQGAMGEYAKHKIGDTIRYLNCLRLESEIRELSGEPEDERDKVLIAALADELQDLKKQVINNDQQVHLELIQVIDEPILKEKLAEMFDEYTGANSRLRIIEEKVRLLNAEAEQLRKGVK